MSKPLRTILYIDDDFDILEVVKLSLQKIGGFSVTTSGHSSEAITLAQALHPDLIMLDVMMPHADGPTVVGQLHSIAELAHIPVIFMTAKNQPSEMMHYRKTGVVGVIPKPFNPVTLPSEVLAFWNAHHTPTMQPEDDFIKDLREKYREHLSARYDDIESLLVRHRVGELLPADYENMRRIVHNLVGSGATYGYDAVSETARTLERSLDNNGDVHMLVADSKALLKAISHATRCLH